MKNKSYYLQACTFLVALFSSLTSFGQLTYKDLHTIYPLFTNVSTKDINSAVAAMNAMSKRGYVLSEHHAEGPGPKTAFNDRYVFADNIADGIKEEVSISVEGNVYNNWKLSEVRITVFTDNLAQYISWVTDLKNDQSLVPGQKSLLSEIYTADFGLDIPLLKLEVRLPQNSYSNNTTVFEHGKYALFYTRTFRN